ncbi:dihydrolipoyl dehydrogenase [Phycisphaera mikurensis]|uniref:Dihydrolipoyl dehydrogenase n=1 Tax=Phycisphaera mikurensis (strain NBRC 102666 / KCTC 22515 / FYK2301M01) TaxID=1142394 RepID=I0IB23_PHYMF|nr:dihydrolipoyl dehydrogenase [Phycisphaera mikurensis]MBB6442568.1 dihydrolipoamide dehydrogenase [Phycisphaera mikurensis]BAM02461.1 dihydrolipoamide dehydrogenase [Phycisphaera mikurensis NBRC 102666]
MPDFDHDLLLLGAGPGGYVAAIRAAQLGLSVGLVDLNPALGGTCLRIGCIPSKALLESSHLYEQASAHLGDHGITTSGVTLDMAAMHARKDAVVKQLTSGVAGLMKKNKVKVYTARGSFDGDRSVKLEKVDGSPDDLPARVTAKHVVIATGSVPTSLPGIDLSMEGIGTSTDALTWEKVPERLVVIGAGVIGLELGSVWRRLGSDVTVVEYLDRILPGMDGELATATLREFKKQGLRFVLGAKVTGVEEADDALIVKLDGQDDVLCDRVLMAVGRKPYTDGLNLEAVGVERDEKGRVVTGDGDDAFTASPEKDGVTIYAIGDCIAGPMLAHKAEEEGVAVAERIATGHHHLDYDVMPGIVYTDPEVASVGKTEEELKEAGVDYRAGKFPFMANGRAKAIDETAGMVKFLCDARTDRVLGCHILGPGGGDLLAEVATAMSFGATSEDIGRAVHAHPTLSEAVKEAALAVDGRALHY